MLRQNYGSDCIDGLKRTNTKEKHPQTRTLVAMANKGTKALLPTEEEDSGEEFMSLAALRII